LRPDLVQPAAPTTLPITLADPPGLALPSGPLTRSSSYSALVRSEDDAPKDYDPDDPNVRTKEPGLLAGLNLTGNRLGQRVHRLLEEVIGNGRDVDVATEHLSPEWKSALGTILQTPIALGTDVTTLEEIRPRAIAEMHVLLPVNSITPVSLSRALLCDPLIAHDQGRRAWAQEIAAWTFGSLAGYFQGYIDLIFEHHGKFYVADYKTNTLPNYGRPALERAMLEHHYLLQARLYTFALHRHLGATLDGYDPATHIGGCLYLFVRGFPKRGVWFERTNVGSLNALDKLFAEASP
jgi:ATP-dependent exoDNAse (exonuclease V) beta subunit